MPNPRIKLTQSLVDGLRFERQAVVRNDKVAWRKTPAGVHDWWIQDTEERGLLIRMTPNSGSWVVRRWLDGKTTRRTMGSIRTGETGQFRTVKEARRQVQDWRGIMAKGHDPLDLRKQAQANRSARQQREAMTMGTAFAEYIKARRIKNTATTSKDRLAVQSWMQASPLWRVPIVNLERSDVARSLGPLLDRALKRRAIETEAEEQVTAGELTAAEAAAKIKEAVGKIKRVAWGPKRPGSVDKIYIYCQDAWRRAAVELHVPVPMETPFLAWRKDVKFPTGKRRTRWLDTKKDTGQEWVRAIVRLWREAHAPDKASSKPWHAALLDYYICVMVWGTRLTETALLRWAQVDTEQKVAWLRPETTKTNTLGCVPLTPWTFEIIETRKRIREAWQPHNPYVFPSRVYGKHIVSPQKTLAQINTAAGFEISTHDLRRTMATDIAGTSYTEKSAMELVAAALHHVQRDGVPSAVAKAYVLNRAEILRPIYARRENRLRQIAELPYLGDGTLGPLGKTAPEQNGTDEATLDRIVADPKMAKRLLEKLLTQKVA